MSKESYTVKEIDALRSAVKMRWLFGSTYISPRKAQQTELNSRCFREEELEKATEEQLRTYMLNGITAEDIYEEDKPKPEDQP